MKTTTVDSLVGCVRFLECEHPTHKGDDAFLLFGLAEQYLRFMFGTHWVNQILYGMHPRVSRQNRPGRRFLRAESEARADRFRNQERALRIAELLFNLQGVEGIDDRASALAAGQVEDTYAELEAGGYLARRGLSFRFVPASGTKGLDYDAEIHWSDGTKANCEMKCKVEDSQLSKSGILTRLKDARKQLPAGEPAVVFLKVPESWFLRAEVGAVLSDALAEFFRSTKRVVAVVVRWEEVVLQPSGPAGGILYKYRLDRNPGVPDPSAAVLELLDRLDRQGDAPWVSFRTVVAGLCRAG